MEKLTGVLEVRNGWKLYMLINFLVGITAISFMLWMFLDLIDYMGVMGYSLMVFFGFCGIALIYTPLYAFKHRIEFRENSVVLRGPFRDSEIPYDQLEEVKVSNRFWGGGGHHKLMAKKDCLHIDFKYKDLETVLKPVKENLLKREGLNIKWVEK